MSWGTVASALTAAWPSSATTDPTTWGAVPSAFTESYSAATPAHIVNAWAQDRVSTYTPYDLGVNFVVVADEQAWDFTVSDRPIAVPPDSGYTEP